MIQMFLALLDSVSYCIVVDDYLVDNRLQQSSVFPSTGSVGLSSSSVVSIAPRETLHHRINGEGPMNKMEVGSTTIVKDSFICLRPAFTFKSEIIK